MKKRLIIATIVGTILIGGTTVAIALNNNYSEAKKESISENDKATSSEEENKEEKVDDKQEESNKEEKVETDQENSDQDNSNEKEKQVYENIKPKEQDIMEGYEIFYEARDAYDREDFEEAIRLYETITNRDALAKVELEKDRFYFAKQINDQIEEGQKLYDSGEYIKAKIFMSKLMRGNYMMPKQEARANQIYENAKSKVNPEEEKKAQQNFTYENALEILKNNIGIDPKNNYKYFDENIDEINGCKTIYINVTREDIESEEMYLVGSDGSVISGS